MAFNPFGPRKLEITVGDAGTFQIQALRVEPETAREVYGRMKAANADTGDETTVYLCEFLGEYIPQWSGLADEEGAAFDCPDSAEDRAAFWRQVGDHDPALFAGVVVEVLNGGTTTLTGKSRPVTGRRI